MANSGKFRCILCGYIYDENIESIKFNDLPADWECPECGAGKEDFEEV
jgi:rubredoxin